MSEPSFADAIAAWRDFYMLTAGAAATLLGLLFVAVSLNLRLFSDPVRPRLRAEAADTFGGFLYLVLMPLILVAPDPHPAGLAWPLLIFSLVALVSTQRETGRVRRLLVRRGRRRDALERLLPALPSVRRDPAGRFLRLRRCRRPFYLDRRPVVVGEPKGDSPQEGSLGIPGWSEYQHDRPASQQPPSREPEGIRPLSPESTHGFLLLAVPGRR